MIFLIILSFFLSFNLYSTNITDTDLKAIEILKKEIEREKSNIDVFISNNTYAKIKPYGKFKLKKWEIIPLKENIYKLNLTLKKKKGIFKLTKKLSLYFWYQNNKIYFLSLNKIIKFQFPEDYYQIVKTKKCYILKKVINKKEYLIKLTLPENIKLYLWIRK